ncbi:MAG: biotin transporter BioY [Clostridia bacterium]|nr:biotin transporter BioY [Clostridia bacterium]
MNTNKCIKTALLTALIAIGAFIKIPMPLIPFTLQTFFVMLAGITLGAEYGALSVIIYMLLGLVGLPIFTGGGGIMYVVHPTFGYMIGFIAAAFVIGKIRGKKQIDDFKRLFMLCILGTVIIYAFGLSYLWALKSLYVKTGISAYTLFVSSFLVFVPADIIKSALAAFVGSKLIKSKVV